MIPSGTRFIGYADTVNLEEKKSKVVNSQSAVYTVDDLRGYKVYTALLTQSGGDEPSSLLSQDSPSLTVGVTYQIDDDGGSGWDFTNVGAPNNDLFTYFVATGTTPANWGTNGMLSYNTGAPVVTVLENTIGNIWFTYDAVGNYILNSNNNAFTQNKIYFEQDQTRRYSLGDDSLYIIASQWNNDNSFAIKTLDDSLNFQDGLLYNIPIEIRVYN